MTPKDRAQITGFLVLASDAIAAALREARKSGDVIAIERAAEDARVLLGDAERIARAVAQQPSLLRANDAGRVP